MGLRLTYLVGVTSAPRTNPTLPATLDSLASAGWTDPMVFYDGERRGPWWNFKRALTTIVRLSRANVPAKEGRPDCIMIVEDDIAITPGLRWWLDFHRPQIGDLYSLYSSAMVADDESTPGHWYELNHIESHANGALAYLMRFETAVRLSSQIAIDPIQGDTRTDAQIAAACSSERGPTYLAHCPSFVRHTGTGNNTSLRQSNGDGPARQCSKFVTRINDNGTFETVDCGVASVQEYGGEPTDWWSIRNATVDRGEPTDY